MEAAYRELQGIVRRAKTTPDRTGTLRRSALKQLVEATHSSSVQTKVFAAVNIPEFFQDFPESEEDAINAVYDLCEDQSAQVRMEGYRTLASISKLEKKWVKRNADVLVQLLQSDEPNEVNVVRKALVEHLHMDPRVTLGVLCDQIIPPSEPADQEELAMRDSLRTLVLTFIAGELKKGNLVRYMPPRSEAEDTLIDGLISAIPKLGDSDVHAILNDILMHLDTPSHRGLYLSQSVLQKARNALSDDLADPTSLNGTRLLTKSRPYFDTLSVFFISKGQGNPEDLFNFYSRLVPKSVFSSISAQDQQIVLYHFAQALHSCKTNTDNVKRLTNNLLPFVFEWFSKELSQERPQATCTLLLEKLLLMTNDGLTISSQILQSVRALGHVVPSFGNGKNIQNIQELIRSLTEKTMPDSPKPSTSTPTLSRTSSAPSSTGGPSQRPLPSSSFLPSGSSGRIRAPSVPSSPHPQGVRRKQAPGSNESDFNTSHPAKKIKKGGGGAEHDTNPPSLLSRLGNKSSFSPMHAPAPPRRRESAPVIDPAPWGGLTIKGAARKDPDHSGTETPNRAVESSLMNRLNGGLADVHDTRRKKKRGVA